MIIKFLNNNLKNESNVIEPRQSRNDSVKQFVDPFYAAVTQDLQFRKIQQPTKNFGEREREREREAQQTIFSCESCEIFENTYFEEQLGETASLSSLIFEKFSQVVKLVITGLWCSS